MAYENLIGRSASEKIGANVRTATISGFKRWEKNGMVREYVTLDGDTDCALSGLYICVEGKATGNFSIDTPHGKICGNYTCYANSGAKQWAVREIVTALFA